MLMMREKNCCLPNEVSVQSELNSLFANLDRLFVVKTYVKHIFAGGRTTTPSLKTFDSVFERTRCQLYAHVFLRPQLLRKNCYRTSNTSFSSRFASF